MKEECQYSESKPISNLNGMFNGNEKDNQRQLVLCQKERVEDCIEIEKNGHGYISGWHLNYTTTIKLAETKMWLKRSESDAGYNISEKIQSCDSWCPLFVMCCNEEFRKILSKWLPNEIEIF